MGRKILAVIVGIIAGGLVIYLIEMAAQALFPVKFSGDMNDPAALKKMMQNAPAGAMISIAVAWVLGAFSGGLVTGLISKFNKKGLSTITGAVFLVLTLINLVMIPHPIWMWITGIALPIPAALTGGVITKSIH